MPVCLRDFAGVHPQLEDLAKTVARCAAVHARLIGHHKKRHERLRAFEPFSLIVSIAGPSLANPCSMLPSSTPSM
jgi:hypothetical protein